MEDSFLSLTVFPTLKPTQKKILLFGGAFDPVHLGHINIAQKAYESQQWDAVWFIPVGKHPFAKKMASVQDRLAMLQLALGKLEWAEICTLELLSTETNYFYDSFQAIKKANPSVTQWGLLLGDDNASSFAQWHKASELSEALELLVAPRHHISFPYKANVLDAAPFVVSSTDLRQQLCLSNDTQDGVPQALQQQLDAKVYDYIQQKFLYKLPLSELRQIEHILFNEVSLRLSARRACHIFSVQRTALLLSDLFITNDDDVVNNERFKTRLSIAALAHDLHKETENQRCSEGIPASAPPQLQHPKLIHGYLAGQEMLSRFALDSTVIEAIEHHTLSLNKASDMTKLLFCADKIEPTRSYIDKDNFSRYLHHKTLHQLYLTVMQEIFGFNKHHIENKDYTRQLLRETQNETA